MMHSQTNTVATSCVNGFKMHQPSSVNSVQIDDDADACSPMITGV